MSFLKLAMFVESLSSSATKAPFLNSLKASFNKFCPKAKVEVISTKKRIDKTADVYIVNVMTIFKHFR